MQTFWRLLGEHGTAEAALDALPDVAAAAGVERYTACDLRSAQAELAAGRRMGARLVAWGTPDYPAMLADIHDCPPLLWLLGEPAVMARPMIALVGARNASSLGGRMARQLAADLAEAGFVVVSGLARGIDAYAHEAALAGGTLAVTAGGLDVLYPAENADLARRIVDSGGARISEAPLGMQPQARHFPTRNRIVSGVSMAVVVIEAALKSGSLITARAALDQGREVLAVPGHPFDGRAGGCNALIRDGARLVRHIDDVLEALPPVDQPALPGLAEPDAAAPPAPPADTGRSLADTAALHRQILDRLGPSPIAEDQLIRDMGSSPATIAPAITDLELGGLLSRRPGGLLTRE